MTTQIIFALMVLLVFGCMVGIGVGGIRDCWRWKDWGMVFVGSALVVAALLFAGVLLCVIFGVI